MNHTLLLIDSPSDGKVATETLPSDRRTAGCRVPECHRATGTCAPCRLYVGRMTEPPAGAPAESGDRAVRHAANPATDAAGAAEMARDVRDLLASALGQEYARAGAEPPVEVVDIGANPIDGDPPYRLLMDAGLCRVTGFEPQPRALTELRRLAGPHERYLPYAVGDGDPHTLYLTATSGFASLLEPDDRQLSLLTDFPRLAAVTGREVVDTRRLDAIEEIDRIDLLKIDIQGGELSVLRAGRQKLAGALAVQTEVGFHRLYRDQPTFADVDLELRAAGFRAPSIRHHPNLAVGPGRLGGSAAGGVPPARRGRCALCPGPGPAG